MSVQFAEELYNITILVGVSAFGLLYLVGYGIYRAVYAAFRQAKLQWQYDWHSQFGVGFPCAVGRPRVSLAVRLPLNAPQRHVVSPFLEQAQRLQRLPLPGRDAYLH